MFSLGYAPPPYDPPRISVWCIRSPLTPRGALHRGGGPHRDLFGGCAPHASPPPLIRLSRWDGMRRRELVWDGMRRRRSWNGRSWNGRCRFV